MVNGFTIFEVAQRLEVENKIMRTALEKFRGQFDYHECSGTAEDALDSLAPDVNNFVAELRATPALKLTKE